MARKSREQRLKERAEAQKLRLEAQAALEDARQEKKEKESDFIERADGSVVREPKGSKIDLKKAAG